MIKVVLSVALLGFGCGLLAAGDGDEGAITAQRWREQVLAPPGPVLVDFWAPWCGPCRQMQPVINALAREFKVVKVNVDENGSLADYYHVDSVPTFLIFKNGKVARRFEGVVAEATLRKALRELSRAR